MSDCEMCHEIAGIPGHEFLRRAGPGGPRTLRVGAQVAVMPSLGPLAAVHALVMPADHVLSSSAGSDDVRDEVWRVAEGLRHAGASAGYSTVLFEHGLAQEGGGCGVAHAHVHVIASMTARRVVLPPGEWWTHRAHRGYLLVDAAREHLLISLRPSLWALRYENGIRSQYLRRWIADQLGEAQWDWRHANRRDASLRDQARRIAELVSAPVPPASEPALPMSPLGVASNLTPRSTAAA